MALRLLGALMVRWAASAVQAQGPSCRLPERIPVPAVFAASAGDPARPMAIAGYTLAISWAPQFCRSGEGMGGTFDKDFECDRSRNRFGFVLHGLWPDGEGGSWPQYCRPVPILPPETVKAQLCATPSADLLQHEWAKHGSCMNMSAPAYFAAARLLFDPLVYPDMDRLSRDRRLTVGDFTRAFVAANRRSVPALDASHVRVRVARGGWLQEIWLCIDKARRRAPCPIGKGSNAPPGARLRIWRGD